MVESDDLLPCFVWAGVDALTEALRRPLVEGLTDDGGAEPSCRIRSLLAQERIVERINAEPRYQRRVTRKQLRQRWETHSRYVADVVSLAIYWRHWSLRTLTAEEIDGLRTDPDLAGAISRVAFVNLREARESAPRRLWFLAAAYADGDPVVRQALQETYELITQQWWSLYADVLKYRGLRLRPGIDPTDFTVAMTAMDEGLTMRMLADQAAPVLSAGPEDNLLGRIVHMLIAGCVDPGDGEPVPLAVNRLATAGTPA